MFGISGEHLLVLLVILLVFGPKRLPDLGSSLGRTLRNFKEAMNPSEERRLVQTAQNAAPAAAVTSEAKTAEASPVESTQVSS